MVMPALPQTTEPTGAYHQFRPWCAQVHIITKQGQAIDRISPWIKRVTQDLAVSPVYDGACRRLTGRPRDERGAHQIRASS